ncbi:aminotransferase [Sphingomonas sp. Leaf17]|nr:aminotransferase [Sphingomonas sp. Leaf17]
MLPAARDAVNAAMGRWANPSSPHAEGRAARAMLEAARGGIARAYGWTGETILTSGASESLAIALGRSMAARTVVTAVEHDAVFRAAPADAGVIAVGPDGIVDPASLPDLRDAIVCVQWANSETGVRQPIAALAETIHARGGRLLVDAAQMPAGADADVAAHADMVAISAHKRGGPPGIGALLIRDLGLIAPSGGQERGYRGGTENVPAAIGYAAALAEPEDVDRLIPLRARLDDAVRRSGGVVVADAQARHPAIAAYHLPGVASATQLIRLDMAGFAVSAGSACSSGSMKPSHVLAAMGWSDAASREVIRISFGRMTTEADVDAVIAAWRDMARKVRIVA